MGPALWMPKSRKTTQGLKKEKQAKQTNMPTHTHTHVHTLTHGWNVWYGDIGKGMETSTRIETRTRMYYTRIDTLHNTIDTIVLIHNILTGEGII